MSGELGKVVVVVGANTAEFQKAIESFQKGLGETEKGTQKFGNSVKGLWKQFAVGQIAANALQKGIGFLTGIVKDSVTGAIEAEQSESRLGIALDSTGRSAKAILPSLVAFSKELMTQTTYSDEAALGAMTLLAQLTRLDSKGIKVATQGAMGLATVMGIDLQSATQKLIPFINGQTNSLRGTGIEIDKNLTGNDRMAAIMERLSVLYQQSTGEVDTFGGRMKQLGNLADEVKESFGGALVKNEAFKKLMGEIKDKIVALLASGKIEEWANTAAEAIEIAAKAAEWLVKGIDALIKSGKEPILIGGKAQELHRAFQDVSAALKVLNPTFDEFIITAQRGDMPLEDFKKALLAADKTIVPITDNISKLTLGAAKMLGAWKALPGPVSEAGKSFGENTEAAAALKKELGLIFQSDLKKRIDDIKKALVDYKKELTPESERALRTELLKLNEELRTGKKPTDDFKDALSDLDGVLANMSPKVGAVAVSWEAYNRIISEGVKPLDDETAAWNRSLGAIGALDRELDEAAAHHKKTEEAALAATETISNAWAEVCLQLTADFSQAFAGMMTGATSFADGMKSIFSGLAASIGQAIGTQISTTLESIGAMAGPLGSLVGGIIGGILSVFGTLFESSESYAEQAQAAFADAINGIVNSLNYLGDVSDSTAEMLQNTAEEFMNTWGALADSMGGQGMADAIALSIHLNDVIQDTGVSVYNLADYWTLANTALGQYSSGLLTAQEASSILDDAFATLVAASEEFGQSGSQAMRDFILAARAAGLEIASVTSYINEQLGLTPVAAMNAADGLAAMAAGVAPALTDLVAKQKELQEQLAQTEVGSEEWQRLTDAIAANQAQIDAWALASEDDLGRIASLTLTTFNAMIANGASVADAMNSVGPALDILAQKYTDLGLEAPASIAQLLKIRGVQQAHEELFSAIDGNKAVLEALANTGYLTAESLADISTQAGTYYNQLKAAGLTSQEALATMAPTLQSIHDYAEENGIVLDENTQSLIDQAEAAGLVEDAEMSTADAMLAVGAVIAQAFGIDIPKAMQEALDRMNGVGDAVGDTADTVTDDLGDALIGITDGAVVDLETAMKDAADETTEAWDTTLIGITDGAELIGDDAKKISDKWTESADKVVLEWGDALNRIIDHADLIAEAGDTAGNAWTDAAEDAIAAWDGFTPPDVGGGGGGGGGTQSYASSGIAWTPQFASDYVSGTGLAANVGASAGAGGGAGMGAGTTVYLTINAQTLDDRTINQAAEKIKAALDWQARRGGRG